MTLITKAPMVSNNPLEDALNNLDLPNTLVLINLLSQRALYLQQEDINKKAKVTKILTS